MQRLGLIGGTGLDHWGQAVRSHKVCGVYGQPSANLAEYSTGGLEVLFLPRHGEQPKIHTESICCATVNR